MIELYGMSSPNVRKILIGLEEMQLDYSVRHVPVFRAKQFEDDFLRLNPMAKVPVLVDTEGPTKGEPIFESGAILVYLAETYGPEFLPAEGAERYAVLKWLFMQVANVGPALGNHGHFKGMVEDSEYAANRFRRMAAQVHRALEARLTEVPYLGGETYSIADMACHPWVRRFPHFGFEPGELPNLASWVARVSSRPAVQRSDVEIRKLGQLDSADIAEASEEEMAMFTGQHIQAPSAQAASGMPPWWKDRRRSAEPQE